MEFQELTEALRQLRQCRDELARTENEISKLEEPLRPLRVESVEQLQAYCDADKHYRDAQEQLAQAVRDLKAKNEQLNRAVMDEIVLSNTWFKICLDGDWFGVGKYTSAWGGTHDELRILDWREDLPPLNNQLHFD